MYDNPRKTHLVSGRASHVAPALRIAAVTVSLFAVGRSHGNRRNRRLDILEGSVRTRTTFLHEFIRLRLSHARISKKETCETRK